MPPTCTTRVWKYAQALARKYARCEADRQDNLQDTHVKLMELRKKGIHDDHQLMAAISNMHRDKSRASIRYDKHSYQKSIEPKTGQDQIYDMERVGKARSILSGRQLDVFDNIVAPSEDFLLALFHKYKGRPSVRLDMSVLAEVLGISASQLSRVKDQMLIEIIKHFSPVETHGSSLDEHTDG